MVRVVFEYKDAMSKGEWRQQECVARSIREVIEWYGLGYDCDYRIVSIEEIKDGD